MFLPKFFNGNQHDLVSPLFGTNYWIGFAVALSVVATLFIFKKFYARLSHFNVFRYSLGYFQILIYILYFLFHGISGDIKWMDYFPFQLCSVLDLTSAVILIFPSEKLFSITFPLVAPVLLAFLLPDASKRVYGPDNFFYYQYYLNHMIILFGYFYSYLYGHVNYNKQFLKQTIISVTIFGIIVFVFNSFFGTNYIFIGDLGYQAALGPLILDTSQWAPIFRFAFMFAVALVFLIPFHIALVKTFFPYYLHAGTEINPDYQNRKTLFKTLYYKIKNLNKTTKLKIRKL